MMRDDRELAVDAHVAGKFDRALVRERLEPVEVDAGLDLDAARGDAEVDGDRGAELERGFDLVDAARSRRRWRRSRRRPAATRSG